jgi:hypothetical protein
MDQILKTSIDLVNEKEWWKQKAQMLAAKHKACLDCGEQEGWEPETLRCFSCHLRLKEAPHA